MSRKSITQTIVQYFEDPKESIVLAQIKRISNQAKNKSSKNLLNMKNTFEQSDFNTELNTALNQNLFKEDNKNKFQRRKFQFATQTFKPSIASEVKQRSNLKYWNILDGNDEDKDENNNKKQRLKLNEKHVNFTLNNNNEEKKYAHTTFNPNLIKRKEDSSQNNNNPLKRRKSSFDDDSLISVQKIVRYLDDPKNSDALAEVKRISNQAKNQNKNKTSSNLVHINPYDINNKESDIHYNLSKPFKRRKFQFATQVFKPKAKDLEILQELKSNKNIKDKKDVNKNNKDDSDSDALYSEADEDEDSEFDLDKKEKENNIKEEKKEIKENKEILQYNTRTYNIPYNRNIKKDDNKINNKQEVKEEKKPVIVSNNINKGRNLILEKYRKIEPVKKEPEKYSSNTLNVNETNKAVSRKKDFVNSISYKFDTITDEYKKRNNLTVEKINNKEKIIKNEYSNKNPNKKHLKTYKTEYFWDKMINRLIEKRIYIDENDKEKEKEEPKSNNRSNKYSNNTFNPFNRYKKEFENKTKENNVTQEKIEFDSDKKAKKENNNYYNTNNTSTDNNNDSDKKFVYSRKYKYLPHLYTANTFKPTKTVNINKESVNNNINNNNEKTKPSYRIYQKRQIIPNKEEVKEKENNPKKNRTEILENEDNTKYMKRTQEFKKKIIFTKKVNEPHIKSEITKKVEETKFKKVVMPYSSNNNNNKKKNIRLNMFSGEDDIFKETEQELKQRNKNNIYNNYLQNKKTTMNYIRHNSTNNNSELIDDLEKIEQYSINTYLKNDLLQIYDSINEEFKDFKKDVFNSNINNFENKMGNFDSNTFSIRKKYKFNVKDLCKGKTTTDDIYNKYKKRAINFGKDSYNKK